MKTVVAVIDAGGRGAALIDAYASSPHVDELVAIPGNDLMQINTSKKVHIFPHLKTTSRKEILEICKKYKVSLVDVAQDNAIAVGVSDLLRKNGFKVVGPSKAAGQIEWDKTFSREILNKTKARQPGYHIFDSEKEGIEFIKSQPERPRFIKAYGLAEGKGALPAKNNAEAMTRIKELKRFGDEGSKFLIEDWLIGEEFSAFALCDGKNFQFLAFAQDHKRVFDGDQGENTGGMGCSTPPLVVTQEIADQAYEAIEQTLFALRGENREYVGVIYLGGMVVQEKNQKNVYIIEFNARWGDPETECILPRIKNDWYEVGLAVSEGKLEKIKIKHDGKARIVVAASSKGYPGDYVAVKGREIMGMESLIQTKGIKVYGAGVKKEGPKYKANGGRLFFIVAEGANVLKAREKAYTALKSVSIPGDRGENLLHYRTDIGFRDVNRLNS